MFGYGTQNSITEVNIFVSFKLKNLIQFAPVKLSYKPIYSTDKFGIRIQVSWVTELKNTEGSGYWTELNHLSKIDILNM